MSEVGAIVGSLPFNLRPLSGSHGGPIEVEVRLGRTGHRTEPSGGQLRRSHRARSAGDGGGGRGDQLCRPINLEGRPGAGRPANCGDTSVGAARELYSLVSASVRLGGASEHKLSPLRRDSRGAGNGGAGTAQTGARSAADSIQLATSRSATELDMTEVILQMNLISSLSTVSYEQTNCQSSSKTHSVSAVNQH